MAIFGFDECGDLDYSDERSMIENDQELNLTQERILRFSQLVAQMRVTASPEDFRFFSNSYLAEIEEMDTEVMNYLKKHSTEFPPAEAA